MATPNWLKIYEQVGFSGDKAQTLIAMVLEAVKEFKEFDELQDSQSYENWTASKGDSITINGKTYDVLERFGVDEYWYGLSEILNIRIIDLFSPDPRRSIRTRVPFGFILRPQDSENEVYISIRGTQTMPEWFNNLAFKPNEEAFLDSQNLGKVHRGFHHIYTKANIGNPGTEKDDLPSMKKMISETLTQKCKPSSKVYIVGHSLGAALATMVAAHVSHLGHFTTSPTLYTFASPRVGDKDFSEYIEENLVEGDLPSVYRVINSEDIISAVPLASPSLLPVQDIEEAIAKNLRVVSNRLLKVLPLLPKLDFYHVGQVIPFTLHKGSILENHIAKTYAEAMGLQVD